MKKISVLPLVLIFSTSFLVSCDKIEKPYKKTAEIYLDTTLYPGNWSDYSVNEYPTFTENTNTNVNVLLEDYTGHTCVNCPDAAILAHQLTDGYPNRVFVASIHIDPGAAMSFQAVYPTGNKYQTDHTNPDGIAYGKEFANGFNFFGNPQGTVNRKTVDGNMFAFTGTWQTRMQNILSENNLKVNIQSAFNYFDITNGGFLHVEIEKKTSEPIQLNTVVYVIQDSLVDWQKMPDNSDNEFYVHRDKHLGSIDNNPWGVTVFDQNAPKGTKTIFDYSYKLPQGIEKSNLHFLIYVYDKETYEILQVVKQIIE